MVVSNFVFRLFCVTVFDGLIVDGAYGRWHLICIFGVFL